MYVSMYVSVRHCVFVSVCVGVGECLSAFVCVYVHACFCMRCMCVGRGRVAGGRERACVYLCLFVCIYVCVCVFDALYFVPDMNRLYVQHHTPIRSADTAVDIPTNSVAEEVATGPPRGVKMIRVCVCVSVYFWAFECECVCGCMWCMREREKERENARTRESERERGMCV